MNCRYCNSTLELSFADLGSSPPSNAYLSTQSIKCVEKWFPLETYVCTNCWLVQTNDYTDRAELFTNDYAYLSSTSSSWLKHCKQYVEEIISRLGINTNSLVTEIAANDGYLLQYFCEQNIPCYGVEPTNSTATIARKKGLEIFEEFFGESFADKLVQDNLQVDLLIANNVLAHVPNINDFVSGCVKLLKPKGVATFEFPDLYRLIVESQFDTIYHEHFSYLSLTTVEKIFESHGLQIFDIEELPTHGGSLRVFAQRRDTGELDISERKYIILNREKQNGLTDREIYEDFQVKIKNIKRNFLKFLLHKQEQNEQVVGYGAAAKGNTLLNYSGIKSDLLSYVVDLCPLKQGKYLPGSRIPIVSEERLMKDKPRWIIIFPRNIADEIINQLSYAREWGAKFVKAIPTFEIL